MDLKVYQKETVYQPQGAVDVLKPGIIDIYPVFDDIGELTLSTAELVEDQEEILQAAAMASIFQRGLDPVDLNEGVEWGELMRGEISAPQLIAELQAAVSKISSTAEITFNTVRDKNGTERLSFSLRAL